MTKIPWCTFDVFEQKPGGFKKRRGCFKPLIILCYKMAEWTRLELATSCVTGINRLFQVILVSIGNLTTPESYCIVIPYSLGTVKNSWAPHKFIPSCTYNVLRLFFINFGFLRLDRKIQRSLPFNHNIKSCFRKTLILNINGGLFYGDQRTT